MRVLLSIFILTTCFLKAQDKIFLISGQTLQGKFVSLAAQQVFYIPKDSTEVVSIDKTQVLLIECLNGDRYLIGNGQKKTKPSLVDSSKSPSMRNSIGMQPLGVLAGRVTFVYERLSKSGRLGLCVPFSLTFDPFGIFYTSAADTSADSPEHIPGVSYIAGLDVNYYFKEQKGYSMFMGPRFRFGTDQMMRGVEGYSFQYQFGWLFRSGKAFSQHLSVGYGFVKLLNVPSSSTFDPEQLYGWMSVNYRLSFWW